MARVAREESHSKMTTVQMLTAVGMMAIASVKPASLSVTSAMYSKKGGIATSPGRLGRKEGQYQHFVVDGHKSEFDNRTYMTTMSNSVSTSQTALTNQTTYELWGICVNIPGTLLIVGQYGS